jgi:hypothetical protein
MGRRGFFGATPGCDTAALCDEQGVHELRRRPGRTQRITTSHGAMLCRCSGIQRQARGDWMETSSRKRRISWGFSDGR